MNFRDTMQDCFYRYPRLFPHPLSVAIYLFFVIGNGYEWVDGELITSKKKQPAKSFTRHRRKTHIVQPPTRDELILTELTESEKKVLELHNFKRKEDFKVFKKLIPKMLDVPCTTVPGIPFPTDFGYYTINISTLASLYTFPSNIKPDWAEALKDALHWGIWNLESYKRERSKENVGESMDRLLTTLKRLRELTG